MEDGVMLDWHESERKLQNYLLSNCSSDIRFEFSDPITKKIATAILTKSGDFHIEKDEAVKSYIKPRSRLTIMEQSKVDVSAIVDIDARATLSERMEKVKQAIGGV